MSREAVFGGVPKSIAAGGTYVFDARGMFRMTAYFAAGTHSYQPCDASGNLFGSSANFTSGTAVDISWPFYNITADASNAMTFGAV